MTKSKSAGEFDQLDYRKRLHRIARKLGGGVPLSDDDNMYLIIAFDKIAAGEDANTALGVKFGRGQSEKALLLRQNMNIIMHMVAGWIAPAMDRETEGTPLTLGEACEKAVTYARRLDGDALSHKYDAAYLLKYWHENKHLHDIWRTAEDPGSPFV